MLGSITPLGEWGRNSRWTITVLIFSLSSAIGGAVTGGVMGALGHALARFVPPMRGTVGVAAVVGLLSVSSLHELSWLPLPLPSIRRQVNDAWLGHYRRWLYASGFGFQLGTGVLTVVTSASTYVALILMFLSCSILIGLLAGAAFGLARALPIVSVARVRDPEALLRVNSLISGAAPRARAIAGGALGSLSIVWAYAAFH
jgi:hypothetical protein